MVTGSGQSLADVYATIFGCNPDPEIAATLVRLETHLDTRVSSSTAVMLCIMLRPVDLFNRSLGGAVRYHHDAALTLTSKITEMRSNESLVIARQGQEIERLRQLLSRQEALLDSRDKSLRPHFLVLSWLAVLTIAIVAAILFFTFLR